MITEAKSLHRETRTCFWRTSLPHFSWSSSLWQPGSLLTSTVLCVFVISCDFLESWLLCKVFCNAHNSESSSWLSPEKPVSPCCCGSSTTGSPVTCWPSTSHGLTTIQIFIMQVLLCYLYLYLWTNHHSDICGDLIFIFIFILWLTTNLIFTMHIRNSSIISFTSSYAMQCWHAWQAGDEQRTNRDWGLHILDTTLDFDRFSFLSKGVDHLSHQLIDLGCHLEEQLNPTRSDLQGSTKSQTSLALSRTQETWGALSVPLQLTTFEDDENLEIVELMSMIIKMMVIEMMLI